MERPTKPCHICGADEWWLTPDGRWLCGRCHPNPNPDVAPTVAVSDQPGESHLAPVPSAGPGEEVAALLERVKKGNDKRWAAWKVIRDVEDTEERGELFLKWDEKVKFLNELCLDLVAKGFNDCLYIENGKKTKGCLDNPAEPLWFCNTCPASIGGGPKYWEQELMGLPSPWKGRGVAPELEQAKFLKTLGGKEG